MRLAGEAGARCPLGHLVARPKLELPQDALDVSLSRLLGNDERLGQLAVGVPACQQKGDLSLAGSERATRQPGMGCRCREFSPSEMLFGQFAGIADGAFRAQSAALFPRLN